MGRLLLVLDFDIGFNFERTFFNGTWIYIMGGTIGCFFFFFCPPLRCLGSSCLCSSVPLGRFWGLFYSSIEFTLFNSFFALSFHSIFYALTSLVNSTEDSHICRLQKFVHYFIIIILFLSSPFVLPFFRLNLSPSFFPNISQPSIHFEP